MDPTLLAYLDIENVLTVFFSDLPVRPEKQFRDLESLVNPTNDRTKTFIHRIESVWQWRDEVIDCFRCQRVPIINCPAYEWPEMRNFCRGPANSKYTRQYLTPSQCRGIWSYYIAGQWREDTDKGIWKVHRQMKRRGII